MPSLNALGQFKYSFNNIANEKTDIESRSLPFDDLQLPTTEAPPFEFIRHEPPPIEDLGDSGAGPDINSFLDNITGDNDTPLADTPADTPPGNAVSALDDFLKEIDSSPPPSEPDTSADDLSSFLDGMQDQGAADAPADIPAEDDLSSLLGGGQDEAPPDFSADDDLASFSGGDQDEAPPDFSADDDLASFPSGDQDEAPPDFSVDDDLASFPSGDQDEALPDFPADDLSSLMGGDQEETAADFPAETPSETPADLSGDEGGIPDDLLSGFSDEVESAPADAEVPDFSQEDFGAAEPSQEEPGNFDLGDIDLGGENIDSVPDTPAEADAGLGDLGDLGDFNIDSIGSGASDESAEGADSGVETEAPPPDIQDFGDFDLGGEAQDTAPETPEEPQADNQDSSGIDLGGESIDFSTEAASDDFSSDALPEMDLPAGDDFSLPADSFDSPGADNSALDTNFDIPATDADTSGAGGAAAADTAFDMGDLGADFASDSIELDSGPAAEAEDGQESDSGFSGGDVFGGDDFSLTGLDDILNKTKVSAPKPVEKKSGLFGKKKHKEKEEEIKAEDNIDEISLSQEDVDNLLHTLSTYPLNLRIACEELIAEQVILPEQLSKLIRLLVNGASVRETAAHVEVITGKPVVIPKSFEKSSGAAFEAEQASFAYIFVHNLLPIIRLFTFIALMIGSIMYLSYKFIYIPIKAESIYKRGYERIPAGEYQRANELFHDAFTLHRKKKWFYAYAEAFRDQRRYMLAENKYDELLRYYPRDKKGVLDYAALNTYYLMNYEKANKLLQREILDYAPNDYDGLLAAGDNFLDWADSNPAKFYARYEDARFSYARLIEQYGWQPQILERMLKYFIRTDNLKETLQLRVWFENDPKRRKLSTPILAELGGYLLDKQLEKTPGTVPDPYIESIESVRDMLIKAVMQDQYLPESHYHLARYYHNLGNTHEERLTLENAIRAFDLAKQESVKRRLCRVDTHYRYANLLVNSKEFFPADEQAVRGIELFEDFLNRNLIPATPQLGQLYALRGDLEYFVKSGNMEAALANYKKAEGYGYAPPEIQYRMGAAYYQREDWRNALDYLFKASKELPLNRRVLFAMGNAAYQRGDYFAAQGYYNRLLDILEVQRVRLPVLLPNDSVQFLETGERLMMARNNAGVVNEALARQTGNRDYRSKAMVLYAESSRAWDAITRNPETMTRSRLTDNSGAPSINLGYLNANNALRPSSGYRPQIFVRIDKDALEPSRWEELAPLGGL
jgi:tetratricopeptide (TPR) repeat protein